MRGRIRAFAEPPIRRQGYLIGIMVAKVKACSWQFSGRENCISDGTKGGTFSFSHTTGRE
jgi:hypothetical protein